MLTREQNDLLTQTDAGTPMGDFVRRYWFPAFKSERLPDNDGDPIALKLLGERLVAFRDSNGTVGILDEFCPHRLASLTLARNENCALQCVYHGWRIAADGTVLETPPEPVNSKFAQSVRQVSYPTREVNGMVWVYMGPKDKEPPFPDFPFAALGQNHVVSQVVRQPCNYLQGLEGDIEAAHAAWLHYGFMGEQRLPDERHLRSQLTDPRPRHAVASAPWGLQTMMRFDTPVENETLCLVHPVVMPIFTMAGYWLDNGTRHGAAHAWVPIDDHNHYVWTWLWSPDEPFSPEHWEGMNNAFNLGVGPHNDYLHQEFDEATGRYIQHRDWMREGLSFSGFNGVAAEDIAIQHSMGPIVDRTREHLASEDMVVVQLRRYMLKTLEDFSLGEEPLPGLQDGMSFSDIDYRSVIIDSDVPPAEIFERRDYTGNIKVKQ